jgi:outer membrane receptor protein involved in Fe transport
MELPGSWADVAFGVKATSTKTDNNVDSRFYNKIDESLLSSQVDHFLYKENMQMIYVSVLKHFGEKWDVKAGLRGENTQTNANSLSVNQEVKRNYFKIFPTAYISFKPNEDHVLSLNFGRRIQRPGFWEMNPARWYMSPTSYTEGNPFLQPAYSYNIEFNYAYKSLVNLSLFNSNKRDGYGQVTVHDVMNDSQAFKRLNYFDSNSYGGTLTLNYDLFSWWNTATEISAYYNELNPKTDLFSSFYSGWGGYTTSTNTFSLNKKKTFLATLYYEYNYPAVQGIINSSSSSTLNIGFRSLFFNKKLTVGLNFDDIFRKNLTLYSNRSQDINQTFLQYYDTRQFRISLTYKFGSTKLSLEERETGNQDEKNRSN